MILLTKYTLVQKIMSQPSFDALTKWNAINYKEFNALQLNASPLYHYTREIVYTMYPVPVATNPINWVAIYFCITIMIMIVVIYSGIYWL